MRSPPLARETIRIERTTRPAAHGSRLPNLTTHHVSGARAAAILRSSRGSRVAGSRVATGGTRAVHLPPFNVGNTDFPAKLVLPPTHQRFARVHAPTESDTRTVSRQASLVCDHLFVVLYVRVCVRERAGSFNFSRLRFLFLVVSLCARIRSFR